MKARRLYIENFRQFKDCEIIIGNKLTAIAGNNGTGKSTILGLLANSSELRGQKSYIGKPLRGEFSELFSGSREYDPTGSRIRLDYVESNEEKSVVFRTAWQNKGTRFRVIPKRKLDDGNTTEAKLPSPVIYLGLSRLYPFGEAGTGSLKGRVQRWDVDSDRDWFIEKYSEILSMRLTPIESVSSFDIAHSRKRGTGVKTETYGPITNSAGQDNLGQILMAVLSFIKISRMEGDSWDGGLLLIDEVDATLHPAAQKRLIDLLIKETGRGGFQCVFTTHSTVVLDYIASKTINNSSESINDIEIVYLTNANRRLEVKRNPTLHTMTNDLFVRGPGSPAPKVGVFSEDEEARWLIRELIEIVAPELMSHIDLISASFSCDTLVQLYQHDYPYMKDRIIVFDGDVAQEKIDSIPRHYRNKGRNIVSLPGGVRPEQLIWDFLKDSDESDSVWEGLERYDYTYRSIVENGPHSDLYSKYSAERQKYKEWFKACKDVFKGANVARSWVESNKDSVLYFIDTFVNAYNQIASRTSADPMVVKVSING